MQTTQLSSKGQVIIPKMLRDRYKWNPGQRLSVIDTGDGIILKPLNVFKNSELNDVAGILKYKGKGVSLDQMEEAIKKGVLEAKK
jgi:AbrB family looped-hinge helix DNA binding protein